MNVTTLARECMVLALFTIRRATIDYCTLHCDGLLQHCLRPVRLRKHVSYACPVPRVHFAMSSIRYACLFIYVEGDQLLLF